MYTLNDSGKLCFLSMWFCAAVILSCHSCAQKTVKPEIFYVNSYHKGYVPSDQIFEAIRSIVDTSEFQLTSVYLNAKQLTAAQLETKAGEVYKVIHEAKPDVLIISDDNAMQSLVMKYLAKSKIPVVFCGVNWSHEHYKLDHERVTGMVEVLPVTQCVAMARSSGISVNQITILSEQSAAEEKNKEYLLPVLKQAGVDIAYRTVVSFEEWKAEFLTAQREADLIFLPTQGAITHWDKSEAIEFISSHIRKPVFTCDDFMMPYACYGLTKVAHEQGDWAARAALKILAGTSPAQIPFSMNQQQTCYVNRELCAKAGLTIPDSLLKACNTNYDY